MTDATNPAPPARGFDPEATRLRRESAVALTAAVREKFEHTLGVSYGESAKQVYDLYIPNGDPTGPTLVWLHGGGFRGGSPDIDGYDGLPYLDQGAFYASLGYRLIDEVKYPYTADDVEAGLLAIRDDVVARGADPERIFLAGHSAGAMVAAQVAFQPGPGFPVEMIKGVVVISSPGFTFESQAEGVVDHDAPRFVPDILSDIKNIPPHVIAVAADGDLASAITGAPHLVEVVTAAGGSAEGFVEPDADHFQANRSFSTPGGEVETAVSRMMFAKGA